MAQIFLLLLAVYLSLGFAFAVLFALSGYRKIDKLAASAGWLLRLLWMPAAMALWPLVAIIWARSGRTFESQGELKK